MSDITMAEISKGVWVPRSTVMWPTHTGLPRANAEAGERPTLMGLPPAPAGERPLEPVAAVSYAEARAMEEKAVALSKVFKDHSDASSYSKAEWNEVPETEQPEPHGTAAWFSCVKRYRFIRYAGEKLIIEVELMGGTTLRYILKLSQVKGVLTKSNVYAAQHSLKIVEAIIDQRQPHYGYTPEQVKLKFAGEANALAFQVALMDTL